MLLGLLKRITAALEDNNIPYMLSGSLAFNAYALPRMSYDIDIVIELDAELIPVFLNIFSQNYYLDPQTVKEEAKRKGMFNAIDFETGLKIDFIVRKNTEYRLTEFQRRRQTLIQDMKIWIVTPEDLIISKLEWTQTIHSDKQLNDIRMLLSIPDLDKQYIAYWCAILQLNTFNLL